MNHPKDDPPPPPVISAEPEADLEKKLKRDPEDLDAKVDVGSDESMDASDPPSSTQPVHSHEPPESSGYDAEEEARLKAEKQG